MSRKPLKDIYYDTKKGFGNVNALYDVVKKYGYKRREVKEFLEKQTVYQRHYEQKRKKFNNIISFGVDHNQQADLMDMRKYKTVKGNGGMAWVLVVIDVYSRYAWAEPLKNKTAAQVLKAYQRIGTIPKNINLDDGREFKGVFKKYLENNDVKMWVSDPTTSNKNAIAERFIRTMRNLIKKYFSYSGKFVWVKALPDLVYNYNNRQHSTLKAKPINIYEGRQGNEVQQLDHFEEFKKGDKVRVLRKNKAFDKKSMKPKWSRKIYTIVKRSRQSYIIKNDGGNELVRHYKDYELFRVPKGTKEVKKTEEQKQMKTIKKKAQLGRKLRKAGISRDNIIVGRRRRGNRQR